MLRRLFPVRYELHLYILHSAHTVYLCVYLYVSTAIISLKSINYLVDITETVSCEVRTEVLNIVKWN
jgi:hypothetical protein